MDLKLLNLDPKSLKPNPWNTNRVSQENLDKLEKSIDRLDNFKPIMVRELKDGTYEIIGGEHRQKIAIKKNLKTVHVLNLGHIDDEKAKEIGLADNERYGEDDTDALVKLMNSLDNPTDLSSFLPISPEAIDLLLSFDDTDIDFDDLDFDEESELPTEKPEPSSPSSRIVRFKLSIADAEWLSELVEKTQKKHGLRDSDDLTNAGDALMELLSDYK